MTDATDDRDPTVPVKRVEHHDDGVTTWVIDCPHCGEEHTHGAGPGHRVAHCLGGRGYYLTRRGWPFPADERVATTP
jgi:hypothetical protein